MTGRGREYASALFATGLEDNCLEEINDGLKVIKEVLDSDPMFADFLLSPAIPKEDRVKAVEEAFGKNVHEHITAFLCILTSKGHIRDLDECIEVFDELYKDSMKKSVATVTSAVELTPEQKDKLQKKLEKMSGKELTVTYRIDKSLIGGIVVESDGTRLDGSIKRRLKEIKEVMEQ
ncbi:MAG: ATP synthase F1 subunit delta [Clostridiales bacterium]|nr:ATP synthase F1 subunit delta [Clostridiales bacterium]